MFHKLREFIQKSINTKKNPYITQYKIMRINKRRGLFIYVIDVKLNLKKIKFIIYEKTRKLEKYPDFQWK